MKKITYLFIICLPIVFFCCSNNDEGENSIIQLFNNGTGMADIQIKTSVGSTENLNDIETGTYSEKRPLDPGETEFTIAIQGVQDPIVYYLTVNHYTEYLVTINEDNTVAGTSIKFDYLNPSNPLFDM